MDSLRLSLCITTYNRPELTIQAFEKVYNDPRIDEIVIVDDNSDLDSFNELIGWGVKNDLLDKMSIYRNPVNVGMSRNKARAIELAKNDWCILFDSDNILDTDYLDAFYKYVVKQNGDCPIMYEPEHANTIFCPDFAKPNFDYTFYSNLYPGIYGAKQSKMLINEDSFNCLMNTCNYIVNRQKYLNTYQYNPDHIASDTIWHNYNHLKAGGIFAVVPNMQYYHRVHAGSGFMHGVDYNLKQVEKVRKLIQCL